MISRKSSENPDNPFETELIETSDGSHTLKLKGIDEQYHSTKGALQESRHVFLNAGFMAMDSSITPVRILEVGFGTGLNALITARNAIINKKQVFYEAMEPYPVAPEVILRLNYYNFFEERWMEDIFKDIHTTYTESFKNIHDHFFMRVKREKIQSAILPANHFNLVYFDAFGPDTQPEMWTQDVFELISNSMMTGAVLVTYCSKGSVRRAMQAAGLEVHKIPGPPGKREISRAYKK
jgi:tRNA U34 5-methylaminomethyl-2-thiouridine-forming methyltransferase MnmC